MNAKIQTQLDVAIMQNALILREVIIAFVWSDLQETAHHAQVSANHRNWKNPHLSDSNVTCLEHN